MLNLRPFAALAACVVVGASAFAVPSSVEHTPGSGVFGEAPSITQREPDVPREDEPVDLYCRVSFQFSYDRVCIYYTTDGSDPSGSFGSATGTTQVLRNDLGSITFLRNESSGGTRDWWKATLPPSTRQYVQTIKYKISAWQQFNGAEVFANSGAAYSYANKLAWPGAGAGNPSPALGYPPVSFWKEEAIFGNTFCAGQIDQNGTVYDMHFPTPGGVYGVGTRNEGYVDGADTFPAGLPPGWRGQMHLNQAMPGIRIDGVTYWLSNQSALGYDQVAQSYVADSNSIRTTQRLYAGGNNIAVEQFDFAPISVAFPADGGGNPQRHLYLKRLRLTNNAASPKSVNVYWYLDPALNGGDNYDAMFVDPANGAMVAYDNTYRVVTGTGTGFTDPNEYNPTTSSGYEKNKSIYLACAMKVLTNSGSIAGTATDFWRDTSADNSQGWMGTRVTLPPGQPVEVDFVMAGALDDFAGAAGTYTFKLQNAMQWFYTNSIAGLQSATDSYWSTWLNSNTTIDTPNADYDSLFRRGLLATALHVDGVNGGVIAGFHNGAYPYVWPRDAVYAAITLARTGHLAEAEGVYRWMRDTCYRDFEGWGRKGFWKQKYSTDGYVILGAPQIDETAVLPWGVWFQYQMTGDAALLSAYLEQVRDAVQSCTQSSTVDPTRLHTAFGLMFSNNVWEDSYDTFNYSNANIVRGLRDASNIFNVLGLASEASNASSLANSTKSALDARLDWDGENTDVSALGVVYPFEVYSPTEFRATRLADRLNGVRKKLNNSYCCSEPLVNFAGENAGTINRYWGDNYWNGGPWFLSTMWYGLYYAQRQDANPGTSDIDNHKARLDLCVDRLGPTGLGAEQIAPDSSLFYASQTDFRLQTAWPNAWESMSTFVDALMIFLDYQPDAPANTMRFEPKLPSSWSTMTFHNVILKHAGSTHKVDLSVTNHPHGVEHAFTNTTGLALNVQTVLRTDPARCYLGVARNGVPITASFDVGTGRVGVASNLDAGAMAPTSFVAGYCSADLDDGSATGTPDGGVDINDLLFFLAAYEAADPAADIDNGTGLGIADGGVDINDLLFFLGCYEAGCT